MPVSRDTKLPQILTSCYYTRSREGEQFVPEHIFSYQVSGQVINNDGDKELLTNPGDFRFARRNKLIKFTKIPPEGGEYKSISIVLDQDSLRNYSIEHGITATPHADGAAIMQLTSHRLYKGYIDSLMPYLQMERSDNTSLFALKVNEAIMLLLKINPELKDTLFDFSEPGKIDLEGFMNKNYHFNVELKRFAYLTGRSLATFKRDFEKIFNLSPSKWLQKRRLQEAYYLIKQKGKAPSDVYLDLGFQDLSHFSFAFKKTYGVAPSRV